ncbi:hypothetical protein RND64_08865 [Gordonia sp. w5E2]|nr:MULTISPECIES: hypothetical protein [Gordonia]
MNRSLPLPRYYAAVIVCAALVYLVPLTAMRICLAIGWYAS